MSGLVDVLVIGDLRRSTVVVRHLLLPFLQLTVGGGIPPPMCGFPPPPQPPEDRLSWLHEEHMLERPNHGLKMLISRVISYVQKTTRSRG